MIELLCIGRVVGEGEGDMSWEDELAETLIVKETDVVVGRSCICVYPEHGATM